MFFVHALITICGHGYLFGAPPTWRHQPQLQLESASPFEARYRSIVHCLGAGKDAGAPNQLTHPGESHALAQNAGNVTVTVSFRRISCALLNAVRAISYNSFLTLGNHTVI